jgi:hypothetical protein
MAAMALILIGAAAVTSNSIGASPTSRSALPVPDYKVEIHVGGDLQEARAGLFDYNPLCLTLPLAKEFQEFRSTAHRPAGVIFRQRPQCIAPPYAAWKVILIAKPTQEAPENVELSITLKMDPHSPLSVSVTGDRDVSVSSHSHSQNFSRVDINGQKGR